MHSKSGIYTITNVVNGNIYVGCSKDIWQRWRCHYDELIRVCHSNHKLQQDWNQYGKGSFTFEIVLECSEDRLLDQERDVIEKLKVSIGDSRLLNLAMVEKGLNGERLTDAQALEIKTRAAAGEVKKDLAKEFDVCYATVMNLCSGKTYSRISVS